MSLRPRADRRLARLVAVWVALAGAVVVVPWVGGKSPGRADSPICGTSVGATPHITKVLWIVMENVSYGALSTQIPGSPSASYIDNTLIAQCGSTSHYHAASHPSYPNYLAMTSGSTQGINSDHLGYFPAASIFSQVDPSWRSYQEYMPTGCDHVTLTGDATTHQYYAAKHNPAASYSALPVGAPAAGDCPANDEALGSTTSGPLISDVQAGTLPQFSLVTPGLCNDMHLLPAGDTSCPDPIGSGDSWLASWIPPLTSGPDYVNGNLVIDVVWDEGRGGAVPAGGDCTATTDVGCIVPAIVISPYTPHVLAPLSYSHYSLLETTEHLLGLSYLAHAADPDTYDMCGAFGLCPQASQPPTAEISATCAASSCTFDGTGSTDPDGSITGYAWTFGDGTSATGATVTHAYSSAGTYPITLTVTDDQGATATTANTVSVTGPPPPPTVTLQGAADRNTTATTTHVQVPPATTAGDQLLLLVSINSSTAQVTGPGAGWALVGSQRPTGMTSTIWQKTATAADAGSTVTLSFGSTYKTDLTIADYRGVTPTGVRAFAVTSDANTAAHLTPALSTVPGDWVVSYWADKSPSTTSWTPPPTQTVENTSTGTLSPGHVTSLLTDYGSTPITTTVGPLTATTNAPSSKSTQWTLDLAAS